MKFGIHIDISVKRPFDTDSEHRAFDHALEQAVQAEALGFDYCWAGEHHFLEEYSHAPAPDVLLAAVAAKTSRIRVGACVLALPSNHPATLAERLAVLDLISHGRVELAIGRPETWAELSGLHNQDVADAWQETVRALPHLWTKDRTSLTGAHFTMAERAVLPKPYQKPHPQLWAAASDAAGEVEAASLGLGVLSAAAGDFNEQARRVMKYREAAATADPAGAFVTDQFAVADLLYCHDGGADAETGARLLATQRELAAQPVSARELGGRGQLPQATGLLVGDPKSIIDTLRAWETMGVDCVNFRLNAADAASREEVLASLRLFALEVMPVFTRQRARAAAE